MAMQSLATISEQCFDRYWKGMMLNASECVGLGAGMIEEGCLRNGLPIRFTSRKPDEQP